MTRRRSRGLAVLVGALSLTVGSSLAATASPAGRGSGTVDVAYAASLQTIMEQVIGPKFRQATGYSFTGFSGASGTLANEIKGDVLASDVFISAATTTNYTLEGAANGNWVSWFTVFGSSPLVIGYNPHSAFAAQLKSKPWYDVITEPGLRVGRTDPATDPKGKLTVQAITAAAQIYNDPGLTSVISGTGNVYPEQTLVGLLQSGQLDAGFFYSSEAVAAHIPTISLRKIYLAATYTATILNGARDHSAAEAFMKFLLGPSGTALLKKQGLQIVRHRLVGSPVEVPKAIRSVAS